MDFDNSSVDNRQKQEEERRKLRRVYSTAIINDLIKERSMGYDIPYDAFFMRDLDLRAPNVTFRMTDEELEEYQKCYDNASYYVENYCKFMTDHGQQVVDLRDFQRNVVKTVTDEVYIPDLGEYGPKNRNVIWMAARQSGKCHLYSTAIDINKEGEEKQESVGEIYNENTNSKSLLMKLKKCLYKIYSKL